NSVASLRPSSGLILGKTTGSEAASVGGPRTSGVAALMAVSPRGRVPDACGAIVTPTQQHAQPAHITPPPAPAALPARGSSGSGPRVPSAHTATLAPTLHPAHRVHYRSRRRVCAVGTTLASLSTTLASDVQHEEREVDHEKKPRTEEVHANRHLSNSERLRSPNPEFGFSDELLAYNFACTCRWRVRLSGSAAAL
ncbi:jg919, partial [Pararge aegeria aegeria]